MNRPFRVSSAAVKPRDVMTESSASGTGWGTLIPVVAGGIGGSVTVASAGAVSSRPRLEAPATARVRNRDDEVGKESSLMCMNGRLGGPEKYHGWKISRDHGRSGQSGKRNLHLAGGRVPRHSSSTRMSATLRLYTDFVCPFCFIAEQSTVPRLLADFDLTLDWRGFELHPSTPKGGLPLQRLFPGRDLAQMHEGTTRFAARFGVTDFQPPARLQNSRRALAVAEWARATGRLEPIRAAAFSAHWRQGKDLEADADLRAIAAAAALNPDEARGAAGGTGGRER